MTERTYLSFRVQYSEGHGCAGCELLKVVLIWLYNQKQKVTFCKNYYDIVALEYVVIY